MKTHQLMTSPLKDTIELSRKLASRINETFKPDLVVGVLRDGFLPSVEAAEQFGVQYEFVTVSRPYGRDGCAELVNGITYLDRRTRGLDFRDWNVLLLDDTYETGRSLDCARRYLDLGQPKSIKTAVLNFMPRERPPYELVRQLPDFWEVRKPYVNFPWILHSPAAAEYGQYIREKAHAMELGSAKTLLANFDFTRST